MALPTPSRNSPDPDDTASPYAGGDYAKALASNVQRLFDMTISHLGTIGGSANAITAVSSPVLLADPVHGQTFRLAPTANNSGAVTLNIDGRGARAIRDASGVALAANALVNGKASDIWFDAGVNYFRLSGMSLVEAIASLAATAAASNLWETIAEETLAAPAASKEYVFTQDKYEKIEVIMTDLLLATTATLVISLRQPAAAVLTLTTTSISPGFEATGIATFVPGRLGDKLSIGFARVADQLSTTHQNLEGAGTHGTSVDRVRITAGAGNINAGRITVRGRRQT